MSKSECAHEVPLYLPCSMCVHELQDKLSGNVAMPEIEAAPPQTKPTNPKDAVASDKISLHLVPASFKAFTALALTEGMLKYGAWNWRAAGARASIYVSALQRHVDKWFNGEDMDPETGVPHLANACACLAVLIDSLTQGNLTDDRPPVQRELPHLINVSAPATVASLRITFAGYAPRHCTIEDSREC